MIQLTYYVPEQAHEPLKQQLFAAGAGKLGNYDQCCWSTLGEGQFRPLKGSQPRIGKTDHLTQLPEYKVEMICDRKNIEAVIKALLQYHPYEQPAYMLIEGSQAMPTSTEKLSNKK